MDKIPNSSSSHQPYVEQSSRDGQQINELTRKIGMIEEKAKFPINEVWSNRIIVTSKIAAGVTLATGAVWFFRMCCSRL